MDHPLIDLINARIAAAEQEGAFDNLPGAGQPLPARGTAHDPMMQVLKDNGAVPEAVIVMRDLATLREALRDTGDRTQRQSLIRDIAVLETRLEQLRKG